MEDDILDPTLSGFQNHTELFDFQTDESILNDLDDWLDDAEFPSDLTLVELDEQLLY